MPTDGNLAISSQFLLTLDFGQLKERSILKLNSDYKKNMLILKKKLPYGLVGYRIPDISIFSEITYIYTKM